MSVKKRLRNVKRTPKMPENADCLQIGHNSERDGDLSYNPALGGECFRAVGPRCQKVC